MIWQYFEVLWHLVMSYRQDLEYYQQLAVCMYITLEHNSFKSHKQSPCLYDKSWHNGEGHERINIGLFVQFGWFESLDTKVLRSKFSSDPARISWYWYWLTMYCIRISMLEEGYTVKYGPRAAAIFYLITRIES